MSCFVINYLHRADEQTTNSVQWFHHIFYDSLLQTDTSRTQYRTAGKLQCLGFSSGDFLVKQTEEWCLLPILAKEVMRNAGYCKICLNNLSAHMIPPPPPPPSSSSSSSSSPPPPPILLTVYISNSTYKAYKHARAVILNVRSADPKWFATTSQWIYFCNGHFEVYFFFIIKEITFC